MRCSLSRMRQMRFRRTPKEEAVKLDGAYHCVQVTCHAHSTKVGSRAERCKNIDVFHRLKFNGIPNLTINVSVENKQAV